MLVEPLMGFSLFKVFPSKSDAPALNPGSSHTLSSTPALSGCPKSPSTECVTEYFSPPEVAFPLARLPGLPEVFGRRFLIIEQRRIVAYEFASGSR